MSLPSISVSPFCFPVPSCFLHTTMGCPGQQCSPCSRRAHLDSEQLGHTWKPQPLPPPYHHTPCLASSLLSAWNSGPHKQTNHGSECPSEMIEQLIPGKGIREMWETKPPNGADRQYLFSCSRCVTHNNVLQCTSGLFPKNKYNSYL